MGHTETHGFVRAQRGYELQTDDEETTEEIAKLERYAADMAAAGLDHDPVEVEYQYFRWDRALLAEVHDGGPNVYEIDFALSHIADTEGNEGLRSALIALRDGTGPTIDGKPADLYIRTPGQSTLRLRRVA